MKIRILLAGIVACTAAASGQAQQCKCEPAPASQAKAMPSALVRQYYTRWELDPAMKRYTCYYCVEATSGQMQRHIVVYYPQDPERKAYLYYFNPARQEYWGRCRARQPDDRPKAPRWSVTNAANQGWESLPEAPAVPINGVAQRVATPPDPPFN